MSLKNINIQYENKLFNATIVSACGLWLLYFSSLYKTNGGGLRLSLFTYPQIIVFMIFGMIQAFNFSKLSDPIYNENTLCSVIRLIGNTFVYTAFYNIVLLPFSGFGIIEWLLVAFVIFSDFFNKIIPKKTLSIGQSPFHVLVFGLILFLVKVAIFYIFPNNIYNALFVGNKTARFLLVILAIGAIRMILVQLKKHSFPKKETNNEHAVSNQLWVGIKKTGLFIKNAMTTLFSLPVLLIILLLAFTIFSAVTLFIGARIVSDVLALIEPILEQMMKTGKNAIPITHFYTIWQIISFFFILLYQITACKHLDNTAMRIVTKLYNEIEQQYPALSEDVQEVLENDKAISMLLIAAAPARYLKMFIKRYKDELNQPVKLQPAYATLTSNVEEAEPQSIEYTTAALPEQPVE